MLVVLHFAFGEKQRGDEWCNWEEKLGASWEGPTKENWVVHSIAKFCSLSICCCYDCKKTHQKCNSENWEEADVLDICETQQITKNLFCWPNLLYLFPAGLRTDEKKSHGLFLLRKLLRSDAQQLIFYYLRWLWYTRCLMALYLSSQNHLDWCITILVP